MLRNSCYKINHLLNLISGTLFFCVAVFFIVLSMSYSIGSIDDPGPGFFPLLIGSLLGAAGLGLVIKDLVWKS